MDKLSMWMLNDKNSSAKFSILYMTYAYSHISSMNMKS